MRYAVRRADLPAVAETRRLLRDQLRLWGVPALVDTAELLTTELVTNALQHTGGGAVLTATLSPGVERGVEQGAERGVVPGAESGSEPGADHRLRVLRVEVHDSLARRPGPRVPEQPGEHGTSGRGLLLVEALADSWGVHARDTGKVVWFELDVRTA